MPRPEVAFSDDFIGIVNRLDASDVKRVWDAVDQFRSDPDHQSLRFHPVEGDASGRLHTFRASRDLRVLVARQGSVFVLLEADHHDALYERAGRLRFIANPKSGFVGLVDLVVDDGPASTSVVELDVAPSDRRAIFEDWRDVDLADAGFSAAAIAQLRRCTSEEELAAVELADEDLLRAIDLIELTPEQWRAPSLDPAADAEARFRDAILEYGALAGISQLFTPDEVARLAAAPIEDWMIFLHPDQRGVVRKRYGGPARVRGSAGTGKTVVALHRAAELARRFADEEDKPRPILFTTYIRTLAPVLGRLYERLPTAMAGAVEFVSIDKLARDVCTASGDRLVTDRNAIDAAYTKAFQRRVVPKSPIASAGLTRGYLRDEITAVIKGRGVRSVDEYLGMERTGRGTRLTEPLRRQVWELMQEWDGLMAEKGTVDFIDVVRRARDHARRRPAPRYRSAIIDEAQDLSLVGLQLVRALVNGPDAVDRTDGLLIVGDGAQRIYAGGFTLRQAGIEVRGRTTVLSTNYRNTREIAAAAMAVAGDQAVDDLGDEYRRSENQAAALRAGLRPVLACCASVEDEMNFVAARIQELVESGAIGYGDLAVCAATNKQVDEVKAALETARIPVQTLDSYDGKPTNRVKVGTHHRAKGLEFKVVFLPRLGAADFPRPQLPGQAAEEYAEELGRSVSQLFVAMTRARDGLFLLCSPEPSPALNDGLDSFELIDA